MDSIHHLVGNSQADALCALQLYFGDNQALEQLVPQIVRWRQLDVLLLQRAC